MRMLIPLEAQALKIRAAVPRALIIPRPTVAIRASSDSPTIAMEDDVQQAANELREFLFESVYRNPVAKGEESKAQDMLMHLFDYYINHPDKLPELYRKRLDIDTKERCACDFISGMTDRYAIEVYTDLCIPKVWRGPHQ